MRGFALVALLAGAMATATFLPGALAVVTTFIIDEFALSRSQLGVAFTAFSLAGAAASPMMGVLTDRSPARVMAGLFALSAVAVLVVAAAPTFGLLVVGSMVGGFALGAGNPVTNRVISERISEARRGLVVGVKQAGPPLGLLLAGALLAPLAVTVGWRWALATSALIPVAGLLATPLLLGGSQRRPLAAATRMSEENPATRSLVFWLTLIGLGVALGLSAVIAFVPLYAQERVGASATTAGSLAAVMGLAGVAGRVGWGAVGGRFIKPSRTLLIISAVSLVATVAVASAEMLGLWVLWLGVIGVGGSMLAWHAVAWLVVIERVGPGGVGRASGVMQLGHSAGFAVGPPMVGAMVDTTGSYGLAWGVVSVVLALTGLMTLWTRLEEREPEAT